MRKSFICLYGLLIASVALAETQAVSRGAWYFNETNTSSSADPTQLKYLKFYDQLPDEIVLEAFKNLDLSQVADGKRLYIGYGTVDPKGITCRTFSASQTSDGQAKTICLPWWRVEREYQMSAKTGQDLAGFLNTLPVRYPPKNVKVCQEYEIFEQTQGGNVVCTSYYSKGRDKDCYQNPIQQKCLIDNCSANLKKNCSLIGIEQGEKTTLTNAYSTGGSVPTAKDDSKQDLKSYQYKCPDGFLPQTRCLKEQTAMMFPYECKAPSAVGINDGEYVYCDKNKPVYDSGALSGFMGKCVDGRDVMCTVNTYSRTIKEGKDPIYQATAVETSPSRQDVRKYTDYSVNVLTGEPDIYSENADCVRMNTVSEAREQTLQVRMVAQGNLDDDMYAILHKADGGQKTFYCNQQHFTGALSYNGHSLSVSGAGDDRCIVNNGYYDFDKTGPIDITDIVTIQQNSSTSSDFLHERREFGSTTVKIDGVTTTPAVNCEAFPSYPCAGFYHDMNLIRAWDNGLGSLGIMFPFAGAYKLYFYDSSNNLRGQGILKEDDFRSTGNNFMQLKLGTVMELASGIQSDKACREDELVEFGGGVYGGKGSISGEECATPNDAYVKGAAISKIIIRDLLTGTVTPIHLAFPLPYPNRIFISKLKVYEARKYRCYEPFPDLANFLP